jgi:hypothetical protein
MAKAQINRFCLMVVLLALSPQAFGAQSATCSRRIIPVSVTDDGGNIVSGLDAQDFNVKIHGRPATILSAQLVAGPRRIAIVLDASGSVLNAEVDGNVAWRQSLSAAARLVERLPRQHSVALVVFATKVEFQLSFAHDRKDILAKINDLREGPKAFPKGAHTALWDAIVTAARMFDPPRNGDVIYAITDGGDNESVTTPHEVTADLQRGGLRFFALWPPQERLPRGRGASQDIFGLSQLPAMSEATGGDFLGPVISPLTEQTSPLTSEQLEPGLDQLYAKMVEYYRVEFQLTEPPQIADEEKLEVHYIGPKRKPNYRVSYPHRLAPCSITGSPT